MNLIQLNPPIEVITLHGIGWALVYVDNGPGINGDWIVADKLSGQLRHYNTTQLKLAKNYTHEINVKV